MGVIFLVGGRGSGKTTVGRALARARSCAFIDLDACLCERAGMSVAEIVAAEGWDGFRARERAALGEALAQAGKDAVIATGGGIVLAKENRELLRSSGLVFWLSVSPELAVERLCASPLPEQRPSLTGQDMTAEVRQVLQERAPLYAQCAHHKLDAAKEIDELCRIILNLLPGAS